MKTIVTALLLVATVSHAQDKLTFQSGKVHECEIIAYEEGTFTVKLPDGSIKKAPFRGIKKITFAANATTLEPVNESEEQVVNAEASGFRSATWGMSKAEVRKTEESEPVKEDTNLLMYQDKLNGLDVFAIYVFVQDRLVRGKYGFTVEHSNENDFIQDFMRIKEALGTKYGKATSENVSWRNDLYRDDRDEWGFAVSLGHLVYSSEWSTKDTEIFHILYGENYDITHVVEYTSKALKSLEEEEKQKSNLQKF